MLDVAIVGAGPAGAMAACSLAGTGLRVTLLEKARLPRHKPCGGGMTPVAESLFDWDISPYVDARVAGARWMLDHERPQTSKRRTRVLMVDRARFDRHLVDRALELGGGDVSLREGFAVSGVEEEERSVTVRGAGGEAVRARYAIGADGALGPTARSLGLGRRTRPGIALDSEVEVDPDTFAAERDHMSFNFACVRNGYGWTFPKDGVLSCGVGSWRSGAALPRAMDAYLERTFPPGSIRAESRSGHPIPLYEGPGPIATRRVCLAGDAASLVDPVLGEGIRFAVRSGQLAADTVAVLLGAGRSADGRRAVDCRAYTHAVDAEFGAEFERLRRYILPIFLRDPEFFFRHFFEERRSYRMLARSLDERMSA